MSWAPFLSTLAAVGAGTGIALLHRDESRWLGPIRTFGLVAVIGVIVTQLLPEAVAHVGAWALVLAVVGFLLPTLLDRWVHSSSEETGHVGVELGYAALLFHQVADGVALGSQSAAILGHEHWDSMIAISAHTLPVTTLVVLTFAWSHGVRHAVFRAVGMALATIFGVWLVTVVPVPIMESIHPWLTAAVAGLLIHIVTEAPRTAPVSAAPSRMLDAAATLAGLAVIGLGVTAPHHKHHGIDATLMRSELFETFVDMALLTAPALLVGLLVGALIGAWGSGFPSRWLRGGNSWSQAMRGTLVGAPLPVCSCGVLPITRSLARRGATPALVVAFLIATPEIGIEAFALSTQFLGWNFAIIRVVTSLLLALGAGVLAAGLVGQRSLEVGHDSDPCCSDDHARDHHDAHGHDQPHPDGPSLSWHGFVHELDDLIRHIGPWTLVGLLGAAFLETALPDGVGLSLPWGVDILVVTVLAIPSYVCASSMTPLAAVMLLKGISPGAVLAGLLLGPATNVATLAFLRGQLGRRNAFLTVAAIIGATWVFAIAMNAIPLDVAADASAAHDHAPGMLAWASGALLVALATRSIWRAGIVAWMAGLRDFMAIARAPEKASGEALRA